MKRLSTLLIVLLGITLGTTKANNDTLLVEDFVTPLNETIVNDTLANGERGHKVYKLKHSTIYKVTAAIKNFGYKLDIIGQENPNAVFPATITGGYKTNGNYTTSFIAAQDDLTLKNIYFMGWADDGNSKAGIMLAQAKNNSVTKISNCIIEGAWNITVQLKGDYSKLFYENNHMRNCAIASGFFNGRGVVLQDVVMDTVIIKNSTFTNINSYALVSYGDKGHNYIEFNQNTVYNIACNPVRIWRATNMKVTNNIFVNGLFLGSTQTEAEGDWFDQDGEAPAAFSLLPLGNAWATDYADYPALKDIKEADRKVTFSNNVIFFHQEIKDLWAAMEDDFMPTGITNNRTQAMIDDDAAYPNIVFENNYEADPGFNSNTVPGAANAVEQFNAVRSTGAGIEWGWGYFEQAGLVLKYVPQSPLPENFSYSNSTYKTAGTNGQALGDLNWLNGEVGIFDRAISSNNNNGLELKCYPNPFKNSLNISVNTKTNDTYSIVIYNSIGQQVKTIAQNTYLNAGNYTFTWDGKTDNNKTINNGLYIAVIKSSKDKTVQSVLFSK